MDRRPAAMLRPAATSLLWPLNSFPMPEIKLSLLAVILGLVFGLPNIYGLLNPAAFTAWLRKFPRYTPIGYPLMLAATVWFLVYLSQEQVSDFASFKPALYMAFGAVGVGACLFVQDYLPVRALAALFLLLAKLMVDTARWEDTPWRWVISGWAYAFVLAGMWFTISPWQVRDLIQWQTASHRRLRLLSGLRLAFGLFVVVLGLTVFRAAEKKSPPQSNTAAVTHPVEQS